MKEYICDHVITLVNGSPSFTTHLGINRRTDLAYILLKNNEIVTVVRDRGVTIDRRGSHEFIVQVHPEFKYVNYTGSQIRVGGGSVAAEKAPVLSPSSIKNGVWTPTVFGDLPVSDRVVYIVPPIVKVHQFMDRQDVWTIDEDYNAVRM
jgi:hypothetical protein